MIRIKMHDSKKKVMKALRSKNYQKKIIPRQGKKSYKATF